MDWRCRRTERRYLAAQTQSLALYGTAMRLIHLCTDPSEKSEATDTIIGHKKEGINQTDYREPCITNGNGWKRAYVIGCVRSRLIITQRHTATAQPEGSFQRWAYQGMAPLISNWEPKGLKGDCSLYGIVVKVVVSLPSPQLSERSLSAPRRENHIIRPLLRMRMNEWKKERSRNNK